MSRIRFPDGFHWGAATASYQIEGARKADGKAESIWDRFTHLPGKIRNGDTGDVACDSYHRYPEDIALLREMNLTSYRFSISWPRVLPTGSGAPNAKGLDYYSRLVDDLLAAGIRPLPTLYHWDLPQRLESRGGWPLRDTAGRFADYAEVVAKALSDRVSRWVLFNEPGIFTLMGYLLGIHAPGRRDLEAFLRATHTVNLAQGEAFRAVRAAQSSAEIGTAFNLSPCEPAGNAVGEEAASERWHAFSNLWFLETALAGHYPDAFPSGAPFDRMGVRDGDFELMRTPLDFIGINVYARTLVKSSPGHRLGIEAEPAFAMGGNDGPRTDFGWEVWPDALYDIVMRVTRDYDRPVLEITENGCAYADGPGTDGVIRDERRIDFHRDYLAALARAIDDGADVRSYHAWSLLDNFEWSEGFEQRFGLANVDCPTGARTLKESGRWYANVADQNGFDT